MFRALRLAAAGQRLLLTQQAQRLLSSGIFLLVALFFLLLMVGMAHLAGFLALLEVLPPRWGPALSALSVGGVDLVLAVVLLLAARRGPGVEEREARALRDMAVAQISLARSGVIERVVEIILLRWLRK